MSRPRSLRRYDVLVAIHQNPRASLEELAKACGMRCKSQVHGYLKDLEAEDLIYRLKGARQIYLGSKPEWVKKAERRGQKAEASTFGNAAPSGTQKPRIVEGAVGVLKKDPDLQARIDMVVQKAVSRQQSAPSLDVVRGTCWVLHLDGLKASRIG